MSVLPGRGMNMDRQPRNVMTASVLAAFAVLSCAASLLLGGGGSSSTSPQDSTTTSSRFKADGSLNLGVKTMYEATSTDPLGDTCNKECAREGKQGVAYTDCTLTSPHRLHG